MLTYPDLSVGVDRSKLFESSNAELLLLLTKFGSYSGIRERLRFSLEFAKSMLYRPVQKVFPFSEFNLFGKSCLAYAFPTSRLFASCTGLYIFTKALSGLQS